MDLAYLLKEVKKHFNDAGWWNERLAKRIGARFFEFTNPGHSIWEEEWDNLIVLDDCRLDLFEEVCMADGRIRLERRVSLGNSTPTFLRRNFPAAEYRQLVYVAGNPFVDKILGDRGIEIVSVWKTDWDDANKTVPPAAVLASALKAISGLNGRKMVTHFLQPHSPYPNHLSETDIRVNVERAKEKDGPKIYFDVGGGRMVTPWPHYCWRRLPDTGIRQGYRENLELVLPYARRLADHLPGRTVITADHGEAFGERISPLLPLRVYGHPNHPRLEVTAVVPWAIVEPGDKRPERSLEEELALLRGHVAYPTAEREKQKVRDRVADLRRKGLV